MKIANLKFECSAALTHFAICNRSTLVVLVALISAITATAHAAAPKVNFFFPAGAQRGQTATIAASGEFSNWPVQIWVDRPGLTATCEKDKGKFKVEVAADAAPGIYWLRLADGEGAAAMKPLLVGTLPEVMEDETNDLPGKPQAVD